MDGTWKTEAFIWPVRSGGMFMLRVAPRPTVTMYESKMRLAFACPTQGQPEMLCAHGVVAWAAPGSPRVGCQNQ
eukprot:COSAG01_NODE_22996_length_832_cov_10.305593_2_plen_74_part_00